MTAAVRYRVDSDQESADFARRLDALDHAVSLTHARDTGITVMDRMARRGKPCLWGVKQFGGRMHVIVLRTRPAAEVS